MESKTIHVVCYKGLLARAFTTAAKAEAYIEAGLEGDSDGWTIHKIRLE